MATEGSSGRGSGCLDAMSLDLSRYAGESLTKVDCNFRDDATACASTVPVTADLDVRGRLFCLGLRLAGGGGETSPRFIARFSWSWALRCLFEMGCLRAIGGGRRGGGEMTIAAIAIAAVPNPRKGDGNTHSVE